MKSTPSTCDRCPKPATFHITDIERGKPKEFHFCDEHARQHLAPVADGTQKPEMTALAEKFSQTALEVVRPEAGPEKQVCPALPDQFPGVPEYRAAGLPLRLRGISRRADAPPREHPRGNPACRQVPPSRATRPGPADRVDPAPQRVEASDRRRRLRDGGQGSRSDQGDRTRVGALNACPGGRPDS